MSAPLILCETSVKEEWIDEFGHMNLSHYVLVCDFATYGFWEHVNDQRDLEEREGAEYAVVETHVNYAREVRLHDPLRVSTQLLGADEKRFRLFHTLFHAREGFVSATNEVLALSFDLAARRVRPFTAPVQQRLQALLREHAELPFPENAGRGISLPERRGS